MRVVLTVYGAEAHSGLPKYYYFMAKHLALNDVDVEILLDSGDRRERLSEITHSPKISTKVIGPAVKGKISKAVYSYNIARYLSRAEFDILHSCDVLPYFYLKQSKRKPVVFQPFSNELFQLGQNDIRRYLYFTLRNCGQKAEALAVVGDWQFDDMVKAYNVNRDKAFVLPVGIDIDFIISKSNRRDIVRQRMNIPGNAFVILSVNILHWCKGINYLIDAIQYTPGAILYIVSSGPEEDKLRKLAAELLVQDRIIFVGDVAEAELYDYYSMADVYAHPTLLNGSSMGIMEAEVFGLPIVSTHQEFLINGNGYVVAERNPKALADGINKVFSGDRVVMSRISKEIVKQYDFKNIAKVAIAKYRELIGVNT